jgi:hypothetical protein
MLNTLYVQNAELFSFILSTSMKQVILKYMFREN